MLLVTGANGQLGTALKSVLPNAVFADSSMLDITDAHAVRRAVAEQDIKTIINCAAYTAVDKAEEDVARARAVNATSISNLAATGAKLIHISTDYVFDGKSYFPYTEKDIPNPQSVYGSTKLEGERIALSEAQSAIIIRTSWVYAPWGNNFFRTMLRLGSERKEIGVVFDQIGTPTYAPDLAATIHKIASDIQDGQREVYHYSNEGVCSWYDFSTEILQMMGSSCQVNPIESAAYPTKAKRPHYSVLNKAKIKSDFNLRIPHWKESLKKCLDQSL